MTNEELRELVKRAKEYIAETDRKLAEDEKKALEKIKAKKFTKDEKK
jgi:two-component SAPR family response regulator